MAVDQRMNDFIKMSTHQKDKLTCDDVFTLYLGDVSKQVNQVYFKTVVKFVLLYRDCMNALGWQKRRTYLNKAGMLDQDKMVEIAKIEQEKGVPEMPWRCKEDL